jgi:hypothetical protein
VVAFIAGPPGSGGLEERDSFVQHLISAAIQEQPILPPLHPLVRDQVPVDPVGRVQLDPPRAWCQLGAETAIFLWDQGIPAISERFDSLT